MSTSPAIDAGDPASAHQQEPAPSGNRSNLGAYGNTTQASKSMSRVLKITLVGSGHINSTPAGIDCPGQCEAVFSKDTQVRLQAKPTHTARTK